MNSSTATVILAAGKGKRMNNPDMAKVMHPLNGTPLIGHVVRLARRCHSGVIVAVIGHQREAVAAYLHELDPDIRIAVQEEQLGTGHAVQQALPALDDFSGDVIILSGDVPLTRPETIDAMLQRHRTTGAAVTVLTAVMDDPTGYGRVLRDPSGHIVRIVEHRDATEEERTIREINSGIYVFQKSLLADALGRITNHNAQGEYYLPDVFSIFAREGRIMEPCIVEQLHEIQGVNTVEQLAELEELVMREDHER